MAEDQPSYTRIIQTGDGAAPPPVAAPGEHPALVWRPKLGEEELFDLAERTTRVGRLNGTFVNGELVQQQLLEAGDRVQIGPHLLVFVPAASP